MTRPGRAGRRRPDDTGSGLVLVLGLALLLVGLSLASVSVAVRNVQSTRSDKDAKAALAAAQAGIDEYLSRLITNDSYWSLGADPANPAFSTGRTVSGAAGATTSFTYRLLNTPSEIAADGIVRLQVTGRSSAGGSAGAVTRTLTATLRPTGFLNYLVFVDKTTIDPDFLSTFSYVAVAGSWFWNGNNRYRYVDLGLGVRDACSQYWYDGRSSPSFTASAATPVTIWDTWTNSATGTVTDGSTVTGVGCRDITYLNSTFNGPYHSNDTIAVASNPLWTDPQFESSWPNPPDPARRWRGSGTPSTGTVAQPGYWPVYAPVIALPTGNQGLIDYTEPAVPGSTSSYRPGCRYTGLTRIRFEGTTMKVLSPATTSAPARCLDVANRAVEQTVAIPPVVYVDATSNACAYGATGYPMAGEWTGGETTDYTCTRGTAIVSGTVGARVTVATRDDVLIAGDLVYTNGLTGTDMLGLIAENKVWVYHPVSSAAGHANLLADAAHTQTIDAVILSINHSYVCQQWDYGAVVNVTLTLNGGYAQKFVGAFGTFNAATNTSLTGYANRQFNYDTRMRSIQPPFFLSPASASWKAVSVTDG